MVEASVTGKVSRETFLPTEVVAAVIIERGRILLTQRRAKQTYPWAWECPGGKVEGTERDAEAVDRELREELKTRLLRLARPSPVWAGEVAPGVVVRFYRALRLPTRFPVPREGQGIGWFTDLQMQRLEVTPGNRAAQAAILREFASP